VEYFEKKSQSHCFNQMHLVKSGVLGGLAKCPPSILMRKNELELPMFNWSELTTLAPYLWGLFQPQNPILNRMAILKYLLDVFWDNTKCVWRGG
jgi:hypothetical protein